MRRTGPARPRERVLVDDDHGEEAWQLMDAGLGRAATWSLT